MIAYQFHERVDHYASSITNLPAVLVSMIEEILPDDELREAIADWRVAVARRSELQERLKLRCAEVGKTTVPRDEDRIGAALQDLASLVDSLQHPCGESESRRLRRFRWWVKALFRRWTNGDSSRVALALGAIQVTLSELVTELDSRRSQHAVDILRCRYREAELEVRVARCEVEILRRKTED